MIGQGSIRRAVGQVDGDVLERPLLDHKANYLKQSVELIGFNFTPGGDRVNI